MFKYRKTRYGVFALWILLYTNIASKAMGERPPASIVSQTMTTRPATGSITTRNTKLSRPKTPPATTPTSTISVSTITSPNLPDLTHDDINVGTTSTGSTASDTLSTSISTSLSTSTEHAKQTVHPAYSALAIAIVPIIAIIVAIVWWQRRKKKKGEDEEIKLEEGDRTPVSTRIPVDQLQDFLTKPDKEVTICGQFESIPKVPGSSNVLKTAKRHKLKDMYANIVPYDHNCVQLKLIPGHPKSAYINASYIDGYRRPTAFIAATGPKDTSVDDFWRMIWEQSIDFIFMLTLVREKSKKKCEQYWPEVVGDLNQYGEILVTFVKEKRYLDYAVRYLSVKKSETERTVIQYQFLTWDDKQVPENSLGVLSLRSQLRRVLKSTTTPILLHCSAGVGRTGTLLAIDYLLEEADDKESVDVYECVIKLRIQRMMLVQTAEQYSFVYQAVSDGVLLGGSTCIPFAEFLPTYRTLMEPLSDGTTRIQHQFNLLTRVTMAGQEYLVGKGMSTIRRLPDVVKNRISSYFGSVGSDAASHIDVASVNSFNMHPTYLATAAPHEDNIINFWQTVWDNGCRTIIMLCPLTDLDASAQYCSDTFTEPPFQVECMSNTKTGHHVIRKLSLTNKGPTSSTESSSSKNWSRELTHHSIDWSMSSLRNKEIVELFTNIYDETIVRQQESGRNLILIHCLDGIEWTGLYCAFSCLLDQIKSDKEIDVFQAVRLIRKGRSRFINIGQYTQLIELLNIFVRDNI